MRQPTSEARAFDVVGFGECSIDEVWMVPSLAALTKSGKLRANKRDRLGGGQIATAMVACARLGLKAAFCATVGDDGAASDLVRGLADEGVDVEGVHRFARATTRVALVLVDDAGERVVIESGRASAPAPPLLRERVEAARVLHLDVTEPAYAMLAAHHARETGTLVSLDVDHPAPGLDELLPLVDLCITARGVPEQLTGESNLELALRALADKTAAGLVGCTLDADGAALLDDGHLILSPAFPVDHLVDTTACGDTFRAAFLCALLEAQPPRQALRFANAAASLKCRDVGRRGCPTRAEVNNLLATT
jgi:sugar/nucleoside kinase (ribokinase family)